MKKALAVGAAALLLWWAPLPAHASGAPTWSTCSPHTFTVSSTAFTNHDVRLVVQAVRTVSKLTGIAFTFVGTSAWHPGQRPKAELVVAAGDQERLAGHPFAETSTSVVEGTVTSALVSIDLGDWRRLNAWEKRTVVLHELGHAVGLGHVSGAREVMNPTLRPRNPGVSTGFASALKALGATCAGSTAPPTATFNPEAGVISWAMSGPGASYKVRVSTPSGSAEYVISSFEGGLALDALDRQRLWPDCTPAPLTVSVRPLSSNGALGSATTTVLDIGAPCP